MQTEQAKEAQTLIWAIVRLGEKSIASGDSLGLVHIWDPIACTVLSRFASHQADVLTLAASPRGDVLLSGGIDAKISVFVSQPDEQGRWVFHSSDSRHTHDIRAIALDSLCTESNGTPYFAGGVAGKLMLQELWTSGGGKRANSRLPKMDFVHCSSFSPILQTASVAQGSRLFLCQRNEHLELWYLKQPPATGEGQAAGGRQPLTPARPESELVLRIALSGAEEGQHICASALAADGTLFAASDASGSRLFHINLEELEVRREQHLSSEVSETVARAMLFCSTSLLALTTWSTHQVVVVSIPQLAAVARFANHRAAVALLATSGEWLASGDAAGAVHVFNTDSLEHHSQVPVGSGQGFPTALAFCAQRKNLLVALSSHTVVVFDVEACALSAAVPPLQVPRALVPAHDRICGAVAPAGARRWLFWTHEALLSLELRAPGGAAAPARAGAAGKRPRGEGGAGEGRLLDSCRWRAYRGVRHVLSLHALDAAQWGSPLHQGGLPARGPHDGEAAAEGGEGGPAKRHRRGDGVQAMVLTFEVSSEAVRRALPPAFERKTWIKPR